MRSEQRTESLPEAGSQNRYLQEQIKKHNSCAIRPAISLRDLNQSFVFFFRVGNYRTAVCSGAADLRDLCCETVAHLAGSSWTFWRRRRRGPWAGAARASVWWRPAEAGGRGGDLSPCWWGPSAACWPLWSTCWHRSCYHAIKNEIQRIKTLSRITLQNTLHGSWILLYHIGHGWTIKMISSLW